MTSIATHGSIQGDILDITTMSSSTKQVIEAWLKYGTVFLIYRLCSYLFFERNDPNAVLFDGESLRLVIFILLGFTLYYYLIQRFVNKYQSTTMMLNYPTISLLIRDTIMFGTVLVTTHVLESMIDNERILDNESWKTIGLILLSFAAYRVIVFPFIPQGNIPMTVRPLVNDWAQFGIFLVVLRLLKGKSLNTNWIITILFVLLGFAGYHLFTNRIIHVN